MERNSYRKERNISHCSNPSFSSTLLDSIYRSIDQGEEEQLVHYNETMRKKQSNMDNFQRACYIEKWMEHKVTEKVVVRRKSAADFERNSRNFNSSSSSSDSSCGGVFSSNSEAESVYGVSSGSSCYGLNRPKPIRTSISTEKFNKHHAKDLNSYVDFSHTRPQMERDFAVKTKNEGGFVKTKSKALKIYGDLKKVKQPISPGGKLASFLNSIFTSGNAKKAKVSSNSANTSTCSSASSFSRSCLSKNTPKSSSNGTKRSVRFYPVSVIVDEDSQPCGHKNVYEESKNIRTTINEELKLHVMEKNRRVEEAAKELLRNYQKKVERDFDKRQATQIKNMELFEDEDDDDVASCASSDLFELDNLSAIGIDNMYCEELPVYETTHLDTNRAIANGFVL